MFFIDDNINTVAVVVIKHMQSYLVQMKLFCSILLWCSETSVSEILILNNNCPHPPFLFLSNRDSRLRGHTQTQVQNLYSQCEEVNNAGGPFVFFGFCLLMFTMRETPSKITAADQFNFTVRSFPWVSPYPEIAQKQRGETVHDALPSGDRGKL